MKIVVAMDSFKGGMAAADVCRAVSCGLRDVQPGIEVIAKPMADGGEGTAAALLGARPDGQWIDATVSGPLPERRVAAGYAWFPDDRLAVIEMAVANGLPLLAPHERNPLLTGTYGTGELIQAAIRQGARQILLAIGGSATVDGGIGAAAALGWQFLDADGQAVAPVGGNLRAVRHIIPPDTGNTDNLPSITVLCDVTNPLCGVRGAAAIFGPQKGATPAMVEQLEAGMAHLARLMRDQLQRDVGGLAGGGAAGGLGAGAVVFMNALLAPGIATIMEAVELAEALRGADWCITGEGSFDSQSLHGKVVSGVASAARAADVPTVVMAGRVRISPEELRAHGIHQALPTHEPDMPMDEVIRREPELLRATAAQWLRGLVEDKCVSM